MEASTTIRNMLAGNKIVVPDYQRAYSWDTGDQVSTFLQDLEEFCVSSAKYYKYYFGHFLFEKMPDAEFAVVDGQQRITTIVIFLSALFKRLQEIRPLSEKEQETFEDIIKRNSTYRFETVQYDNLIFKDYVIDQSKEVEKKSIKEKFKIASARRIVSAFDFFNEQLEDKDADWLERMLNIVQNAACTTHTTEGEARAAQMFVFQNNRGKDPTELEIIKAQFMYTILLYGGEEAKSLLEEIRDRFEHIYKNISLIEDYIHENDVLLYTLRVYFNSLTESDPVGKIGQKLQQLLSELQQPKPIRFIKGFTQELVKSFESACTFFLKDQQKSIEIHSFIKLGNINRVMPFVIKAYKFGLPIERVSQLCKSLESLLLRHRLIPTRADLVSRMNNVNLYKAFNAENIDELIDRIDWMKTVKKGDPIHWGWAYWNNEALKSAIEHEWVDHRIARFLLWKYENHLRKSGQKGYTLMRLDEIEDPELEHIAPQTENGELEAGYDEYDEEFREDYLDCWGNYLLISGSHNSSIGNKPFAKKLASYNGLKSLAQQREVVEMVGDTPNPKWTKELIDERHWKIVEFILNEL